jgi:hypothetical protein
LGGAITLAMWNAICYYWLAARGYRLHPWDSPYLRWRLETFLGGEAENVGPSEFVRILWKYRQEMQKFVDWAAERRRAQSQTSPL